MKGNILLGRGTIFEVLTHLTSIYTGITEVEFIECIDSLEVTFTVMSLGMTG